MYSYARVQCSLVQPDAWLSPLISDKTESPLLVGDKRRQPSVWLNKTRVQSCLDPYNFSDTDTTCHAKSHIVNFE